MDARFRPADDPEYHIAGGAPSVAAAAAGRLNGHDHPTASSTAANLVARKDLRPPVDPGRLSVTRRTARAAAIRATTNPAASGSSARLPEPTHPATSTAKVMVVIASTTARTASRTGQPGSGCGCGCGSQEGLGEGTEGVGDGHGHASDREVA